MAFNDKFHINPATGIVGKCNSVMGQCPFGGLDHHFRDENVARRAFEAKAQSFYDWTVRSQYPQEAGWITEHVFDPNRAETFKKMHVLFGHDIPTGTKLVIENGWVFEKLDFGDFWEMKDGAELPGGIKHGQPLRYYQFLAALENFGGRLEFRDGVKPIQINWRP
jgi:hypothetical protein